MDMRLTIVMDNAGKSGVENSIVSHNHSGNTRDRGECPACDEFYSLHCEGC